MEPRQCPRCYLVNKPDAVYCNRCGAGLTEEASREISAHTGQTNDFLDEILRDPETNADRIRRLKEILNSR